MSEDKMERLSVNDMPEGQRRILDLCGQVNSWYLKIRENNVSGASNHRIADLLNETQSLYQLADPISNFDTNDKASIKLGVARAELKKKFEETQMWLSETEKFHINDISFTQKSLNPEKMARMALSQLSKGGRQKISFEGRWEPAGGSGGTYGDFVRIDAQKDLEGDLSVDYYEVFDFLNFKNSHLSPIETKDGVDLSGLRALSSGPTKSFARPHSQGNYYAQEIILDNIRYTARGHDNAGTELTISINCTKTNEVAETVKYLLQLVKDNPKEKID